MQTSNHSADLEVRAYFTHLLRLMPAGTALLEFPLIFLHCQSFRFAYCLQGLHVRIDLNLPKLCPFY